MMIRIAIVAAVAAAGAVIGATLAYVALCYSGEHGPSW